MSTKEQREEWAAQGKAWTDDFERNIEGLTDEQIEEYEYRVQDLYAPLPRPEEVIDMAKTSKKTSKKNKASTEGRRQDPASIEAKPKAEKPQKEVKVVPITRHLKVQLTDSEVAERADQAAHKWAAIKAEEADLSAIGKAYKARIAEKSGQLDTLQQEVRDHCTYRDVDCHEVYDFEEKIVKIVRLDTNVEIERRDMTRADLQLPLPKPKPPEKDGTETMGCHDKPSPEAIAKQKESARERLRDDGDRTASELKARSRNLPPVEDDDPEDETPDEDDDEDEDPSFHGANVD